MSPSRFVLSQFALVLAALALGACASTGAVSAGGSHHHTPVPAQPVALAATADPPDFATEEPELEALYRWAAAHRAELQYIPCSCGCENTGHKDNWNCFVQSEPSPGRYVWDSHAVHCYSCQEIARVTRRMLGEGKDLPTIRAAIDTQFGPISMNTIRPPMPR
ncbi:MAG: PCYCGC motif-containing (lipo)protein [Candidatus Sericytochromatia bacterium]